MNKPPRFYPPVSVQCANCGVVFRVIPDKWTRCKCGTEVIYMARGPN